MTRHEAREQAFLLLFDKSFHPELDVDEVISVATEEDLISLDEFATDTVRAVFSEIEAIDELIEKNLQGWKMNRISRVSLSALRLALGELRHSDTPVGVVVNEAVMLCKEYSGEEDASFVNGVLRSYLRKEEAK